MISADIEGWARSAGVPLPEAVEYFARLEPVERREREIISDCPCRTARWGWSSPGQPCTISSAKTEAVAQALADSLRVLAPGGGYLIYDKVRDGFDQVERESAEGRIERLNIDLAALEGRVCWGLHCLKDYVRLMEELGLSDIRTELLEMPDQPGYVRYITDRLEQRRPSYLKRWGSRVEELLDQLFSDLKSTPARALPMAMAWGRKQ